MKSRSACFINYLVLLRVLVVLGFSFTPNDAARAVEVTIVGHELIVRGVLSNGSADSIKAALTSEIDTIRITSGGGLVSEGLEIGNFILEHKLNVTVDRACLSSCANYIFLAGTLKVILADGIVCFHGGPYRSLEEAKRGAATALRHADKTKIDETYMEHMAPERLLNLSIPLVDKQKEFFLKIGVKEDFIYPGMLEVPSIATNTSNPELLPIEPTSICWCPSLSDYEAWHISEVSFQKSLTQEQAYRLGQIASRHNIVTMKRDY